MNKILTNLKFKRNSAIALTNIEKRLQTVQNTIINIRYAGKKKNETTRIKETVLHSFIKKY